MPPVLLNTLEVACRDVSGRTSGTEWYLQKQQNTLVGLYAQLMQALSEMSNAAPYGVLQTLAAPYPYQPNAAIFNSILDMCYLAVRGNNGPGYVAFPAPKSDLLVPNTKIVNMQDPRVQRFIRIANTLIGDPTGSPWQLWTGGFQRTVRAIGQ
jgi:hypothetical protein